MPSLTVERQEDPKAIAEGHYARKQLRCKSRIIAWSHEARFRMAVSLAVSHARGKLLDYGCGDGTFLTMVAATFDECVGADIATDQVQDCAERLRHMPKLSFCSISDLSSSQHFHAYRVVTCMETLEHCTDSTVEAVIADLIRLVAPGGQVIISVPIETGPTFPLKYLVRTIAGWRGLSDYQHYETYSVADSLRMLFARSTTTIHRPVYGDPAFPSHSHYGFNWRRLRQRLAQSFTIERTIFSPLNLPGGWFSSQAWFICRLGPLP